MKFKLVEDKITDNILLDIINHFGVAEHFYDGPTYILPDGSYLNLSSCKHHSEVEKWLADNNYENNYLGTAGGSPTMMTKNCIRCDTVKYYAELPETLTRSQYDTLLDWLSNLSAYTRLVEIFVDHGQQCKMYSFKDYLPEDIINKIRRYYINGILLEDKK